jgi:peptide-methionine (R)-S-oxide reductase
MNDSKPTRRLWLAGISAVAGAAALLRSGFGANSAEAAAPGKFDVAMSDDEWRKKLTPAQYQTLRHEATERPFTSPLNKEKRGGRFVCAGCEQALFSSSTKFDSGTGWPSFWKALPNAVGETSDRSFGMVRVEAHCSRCGGHLGHVFDDGPKPTGLRYCMNGVALNFVPGEA